MEATSNHDVYVRRARFSYFGRHRWETFLVGTAPRGPDDQPVGLRVNPDARVEQRLSSTAFFTF